MNKSYEALQLILDAYCEYFPKHWEDEKYKWEAVKHFQEHWNLEEKDFGKMFAEATAKTFNLLASRGAFPRDQIIKFSQRAPEETKALFALLFDENIPLERRVSEFQLGAEKIRKEYGNEIWRSHFQNTNAISTYLWLMYPEKYYIYKFSEAVAVGTELEVDDLPKADGTSKSMLLGYSIYDEICEYVSKQDKITAMLHEHLDDGCYEDSTYKTLTIDVGFFVSRFYKKVARPPVSTDFEWWPAPEQYHPGLSVDDWVMLLSNPEVFDNNSLIVMACMRDSGGFATCTQLEAKYGRNRNFYNSNSTAMARRVAKESGCLIMSREDESSRWWAIPYVGRDAEENEAGAWVWKLRDELAAALEQVELPNPYEVPVELPTDLEEASYGKEQFLAEMYMDGDRYEELVSRLRHKKNIILQGAPGTGKTFVAKRLAYSMMGKKDESRIAFVQFHQNYSYEDFIMGYRPAENGYELKSGIFYQFCEKAREYPGREYFFIIDEINRGNLSKIFGELLMLIEKDYRNESATLAYNGEKFSVPANVYIIGMMNTADRSLALIDYALRRRFSFFDMTPGFDTEGFRNYAKELRSKKFKALIETVWQLNKDIIGDLGSGFCIGHSYFCGAKNEQDVDHWLQAVVNYDIIPTLDEYWFDNESKRMDWAEKLREAVR